jgi:hypothetical protein
MTVKSLCALVLFASSPIFACDYHLSLSEPESEASVTTSIYTSPSTITSNQLTLARLGATTSLSPQGTNLTVYSSVDPAIYSWKQNLTGATGTSPNATINTLVSSIPADVQTVAFTSSNVYVNASGVPTHSVGPFPGNPAYPSNRNRTFEIPRTPQPASTHTSTGLGAIGVMVNGVPFFNAADAMSYNNQNVWHQNANVVEKASFDPAPGHPAPVQGGTGNPSPGVYHYHQAPVALINQLDPGNTGQHHSPLIGFAFDGYPIYGSYGNKNADGTGGIEHMDSSYALRSITQRTTLPNGSTASSPGPAVSAQYPLGYYLEDYEFVASSGELDQYNGRMTVTPEYPQGTYAYFVTLDVTNTAVFPYIIGPSYYGVVDANNIGAAANTLTTPANATFFVVPEPALALALLPLLLMPRRRRGF